MLFQGLPESFDLALGGRFEGSAVLLGDAEVGQEGLERVAGAGAAASAAAGEAGGVDHAVIGQRRCRLLVFGQVKVMGGTMSEYNRLGQEINMRIEQAIPSWRSLPIWGTLLDADREPAHVHRLISSVLAITGEHPVRWVSADLHTQDGENYTITLWTDELVIRAARVDGEAWPTVSVTPRSRLVQVEVLESPILTVTLIGNLRNVLKLRLTYPEFTVEAVDWRGEELTTQLHRFVSDLHVKGGQA